MMLKIDTPCIGICSTVYGDKICRGCKRRFDEVIDWNAYSHEQKQAIYDRLDLNMQAVVGKYLRVECPELLESALKQYSIRYRNDQHPLSWALYILMFADTKISSLASVGISAHPEFEALSYTELCNTIDKHLFEYSHL